MSASATLASICIFVEVIGDRENDRRAQAGRDGLPDIDAARDDDSVDRRGDRAMIEIDSRLLQRAFLDRDHRFRLMERGDGLIEFRLGGILFRDQSSVRFAVSRASSRAACALARSPSACVTLAWKTAGSIWATTCPAFTGELKSTKSF